MAEDNLPTEADFEEAADRHLLPALILGLVEITGPIDDHDKKRAQKLLAVTETREALDAAKLFTGPVNDEIWRRAQSRRKYAEAILRGELPDS